MSQGAGAGELAISYDGGVSFTVSDALPALDFFNVAMSGDGTIMCATVLSGGIYLSTDRGVTWRQSSAPNRTWRTLAIAADGSRMVATHIAAGAVYMSEDGANWRETSANGAALESAAITQDGSKIAIACYLGTGSGVVMSVDGGRTWALTSAATGPYFNLAASLG